MKKKFLRPITLCGCMALWAVAFFFQIFAVIAPMGDDEWYLFAETAGLWAFQMGCILLGRRFLKKTWPLLFCFAAYLLSALMCWEVLLGIVCGRLMDPPGLYWMCAALNTVGAIVTLWASNRKKA